MNFIFDIGNVLIDFKPKIFLKKLFAEQSLADKMYDAVFASPEWVKLDQGIITSKEAYDIFCTREPSLQPIILQTMNRLNEMLTPIYDTIELLPKIKSLGHKLYYLSNYHEELSRYIQAKYQFFNQFDGGVFSCDIHITKPSSGIYHYFLNKYQLSPKDCLFFDDVEENIKAAQSIGINGVLFTGIASVKPYMTQII